MNLALQTRRAVITLSFVALAMACIAAKTATRNDAALSAEAPAHADAVARAALEIPAVPVTVIFSASSKVVVRAKAPARCDGKVVRI